MPALVSHRLLHLLVEPDPPYPRVARAEVRGKFAAVVFYPGPPEAAGKSADSRNNICLVEDVFRHIFVHPHTFGFTLSEKGDSYLCHRLVDAGVVNHTGI